MSAHPEARARQGKIARLPFEIREQLCRKLRDGNSARAVINWLHTVAPDSGALNEQNVTNWRQGGYKEWLSQQARLDEIRSRSEAVRRELEAGGFSILDQQIYELAGAMTDADPVKAARAVAALKLATVAEKRAVVAERNADLAQRKFQRDTCELFLKWHSDQRATQIAEGPATSTTDKIEQLGQLMFGDDWQ